MILFHFKHFEDKRRDLDKLIHTMKTLQKATQIQRFGKENGTPQLPNQIKFLGFRKSHYKKFLHNSFLGELWRTVFLIASSVAVGKGTSEDLLIMSIRWESERIPADFRPKRSNVSTILWRILRALRQFGPKTNSDRKPDSDQRQIRTQFLNSAQIISLINLIT